MLVLVEVEHLGVRQRLEPCGGIVVGRTLELDRAHEVADAPRREPPGREVGEPGYRLSIGLGLLKQRNRFETFLEKAVELGVSEVIPLITHRTEKTGLKQQRAENLLIAAMKQCGRSRLVELSGPLSLDEVIRRNDAGLCLIAHEATHVVETLRPSVPA